MIFGRLPSPKKNLWPLGSLAGLPSDEEISQAVQLFRKPAKLVWCDGFIGNDGFGVEMSFNPVVYTGLGGDFIEIAVKDATLTFRPDDPEGWRWSQVIKDLVKVSSTSVLLKHGQQEGESSSRETTSRTEGGGAADFKVPGLGGINAGGKQAIDHRYGAQRSDLHTQEASRTRFEHWVEMNRDSGAFTLRLTSPDGDDLVRFNSDLDRLPVLSADEPSSTRAEAVHVIMSMHAKSELRHSLQIRDTGGRWTKLTESRNKQVVAELLMSKFLRPVHQPVKLWPRKRKSNG